MVSNNTTRKGALLTHLIDLIRRSRKMLTLAVIYGIGNILSYYALARVGAGTFVVFAQGKTLTTALFSSILMGRKYSWTKWRALLTLVAGVVLFVIPTLEGKGDEQTAAQRSDVLTGCLAVFVVIMISGFASIYFERAIKNEKASEGLDIWARNFQLGFHSIFIYVFLLLLYPTPHEGNSSKYFADWTPLAFGLSAFGAAGGLLVALSIKYGDSVLKTLAISGSIIYSAIVDKFLLGGPLTGQMSISAFIVVVAIVSYTFDATPSDESSQSNVVEKTKEDNSVAETKDVEDGNFDTDDESLLSQVSLVERRK